MRREVAFMKQVDRLDLGSDGPRRNAPTGCPPSRGKMHRHIQPCPLLPGEPTDNGDKEQRNREPKKEAEADVERIRWRHEQGPDAEHQHLTDHEGRKDGKRCAEHLQNGEPKDDTEACIHGKIYPDFLTRRGLCITQDAPQNRPAKPRGKPAAPVVTLEVIAAAGATSCVIRTHLLDCLCARLWRWGNGIRWSRRHGGFRVGSMPCQPHNRLCYLTH